jgi:hypothetical protein
MKRIFSSIFTPREGMTAHKRAFALAWIIPMVFMLFDPQGSTAMTVDVSEFQWKNRLLFLFAPDPDNPSFTALHNEIMAKKEEIHDRDMVIFEILEQGPSKMNKTELDQTAADSLRHRFSVPAGTFAIILVGKDGGVKLKRSEPIPLEKIFGLIDSMPMRQDEMRRRGR